MAVTDKYWTEDFLRTIRTLVREEIQVTREGTTVKYVQQLPGQVGTTEYVAIISKVHEEHHPEHYPAGNIEAACDPHNEGDVTLHVLTENTVMVCHSVPYSAEKLPGTWHHIE
jgi:hypothetical protein